MALYRPSRFALAAAGLLLLLGLYRIGAVISHRRAPGGTHAQPGRDRPPRGTPTSRSGGIAAAGTPSVQGSAPAGAAALGAVLFSGTWGSGEGQLGRRVAAESNPELPMALVGGAPGELWLLDQINHRVQRLRDGKPAGTVGLGGDTARDLCALPQGQLAVLDSQTDRSVKIYGPDGKLQNEVPLGGPGLEEPGLCTGVFADADGVYVEREHTSLIRVAGPGGQAGAERVVLPGRPSRDGRTLLSAALDESDRRLVRVVVVDRATLQPVWQQGVMLASPVLQVLMLDSDRRGQVYLAASTGRESDAPPYDILDEQLTVVRLGSGGASRGELRLPPLTDPGETARPVAVDDDGVVYVMRPQGGGLQVTRHIFD